MSDVLKNVHLCLGSFTFVSAYSFFTGFSFSHESSDSRPSSTVLAATKGGMFNLKKIQDFRIILLCNKKALLLVWIITPPHGQWDTKQWKRVIHFISEGNRLWNTQGLEFCFGHNFQQCKTSVFFFKSEQEKENLFFLFKLCMDLLLIKVYWQQAACVHACVLSPFVLCYH